MSTGTGIRPHRGLAVTIVGLATVLLGAAYMLLGTIFVYSGVHGASTLPEDDAAPNWAPVLKMISAVVAFVGGLFIAPGILAVAGGLGVLFRKQWGRIVTFLLAAVAILWGVAFIALSDPGGTMIALGTGQIVYGVAAFVVMIRRGGEFRGDVTEWTSAD